MPFKKLSSFSRHYVFTLEFHAKFRCGLIPMANLKLKSILNSQTADLTMNLMFFVNFKVLRFSVREIL